MDYQEIRKKYACDKAPIQTTIKNFVLAEATMSVNDAKRILEICENSLLKLSKQKDPIPENFAKATSHNLKLLDSCLPKLKRF